MASNEMRRRDRQVTDPEAVEAIVASCDVVRLGLVGEGGLPYIVPMNFGYEVVDDAYVLYVHGALEGRKWDLMANSPRVFIEMDCDHELVGGRFACEYSYRYASVMGSGTAELLEGEEKTHGLSVIMGCFGYEGLCEFSRGSLNRTRVARIVVEELSAKAHR